MKSDQSSDNGNNGENNASDISEVPPHFLAGNRQVSLAALREQIEVQFIDETSERPDILANADEQARRELIHDIVDYVMVTGSINLSRADKLTLLDRAYHDLFGFGALDSYLSDEQVTELTIDGPEQIFVRYNADEMQPVATPYDDSGQLERSVQRVLLASTGAQLTEFEPVLEVGAVLNQRPARLTIIAPPMSPLLHVDIRLHPVQLATLESCIAAGLLDDFAAAMLQAIIAAGHGLMIVGDVATGKTTLLEALLPLLPADSVIVERAQEMHVPAGMTHLSATPGVAGSTPIEFPEQIENALEQELSWLVLDELRYDETVAMWHAITSDHQPRCLWVFRGATNALRLHNAFEMSVRRAQPGIEQEYIHSALLDRLPFVAMLARQNQRLRLINISEWQPDESQPDTLILREQWPSGTNQARHALSFVPGHE